MALVLLKAMSNSTEWTAVGRRRVVARKGFSKLYLFITRAAIIIFSFIALFWDQVNKNVRILILKEFSFQTQI